MTLSEDGLILWTPDTKVIWGWRPQSKPTTDASLAVKQQRLLETFAAQEPLPFWGLWMREIDLRPGQAVVRRVVWRQTPMP
jgi:hypothetical protein